MSEVVVKRESSVESEKPVQPTEDVKFPPFPEPNDDDFEEDITEVERDYYKSLYKDLNTIKHSKLHCTSCDRHLGCARSENRMRAHPMLRTLVCHSCHTFYNSGEFEKGDDGSELYCRWCGQGGQVYCCSDCPHVFCAKCIKRNLGAPKIKEIENTDDWKCFKCNPKCLWDLRALCWALFRYNDCRNGFIDSIQDPVLKEAYEKESSNDLSECCKHKNRRKEKLEQAKKKEAEIIAKKNSLSTASVISKIPPTIQVKKFASMNVDNDNKPKPLKRPASPKTKSVFVKNPIAIAPSPRLLVPLNMPPMTKKMRMNTQHLMNPIRIVSERPQINTFGRPRNKMPMGPIILNSQFNGFNNSNFNMPLNDNINLSLESLTQGLDMSSVASMSSNNSQDDDVVCTPDFPLEPLCEVTEDNTDDDVQCMTPGPVVTPKIDTPTAVVTRSTDFNSDNIIQMTENDVTVNKATGGLKFRVDPQTLSSNKMYRLPDGRIFAINSNPNMPGGYSATIVAVPEATTGKVPPKGATFAAKLSAVTSSSSTPKEHRSLASRMAKSKQKSPKVNNKMEPMRRCDTQVPVEWFRYNLIDAIDSLEFSLSRLHKLKKEATTMFLRTRTVDEMRKVHRNLERLLNTSSNRFCEIRDNLQKELKEYIQMKSGRKVLTDDDDDEDDDVEILPDAEDNDDPIFIDENSLESDTHDGNNETQEVDLTGMNSSDHNNSSETKDDSELKNRKKTKNVGPSKPNIENDNPTKDNKNSDHVEEAKDNVVDPLHCKEQADCDNGDNDTKDSDTTTNKTNVENKVNGANVTSTKEEPAGDSDQEKDKNDDQQMEDSLLEEQLDGEKEVSNETKCSDNKIQDTDFSDELIETLLYDGGGEKAGKVSPKEESTDLQEK